MELWFLGKEKSYNQFYRSLGVRVSKRREEIRRIR